MVKSSDKKVTKKVIKKKPKKVTKKTTKKVTKKPTKKVTKKKTSMKIIADKRLSEARCLAMTVKKIKQTKEYKGLTPLGKLNKSGTYHYGNKSTMKKAELCEALNNPRNYHKKNASLKQKKINAGQRKRATRKGECLVAKRKVPCNDPVYKHQGVTTTGKPCCFKNKMSAKTMAKRLSQ